jgi:PAS domain S-box-containing protein
MTSPDEPAQTVPSSYGLAAVDPPIPMLILERDFRIRWVSSAAVRELRLEPNLLVGRSWYDLFPESRSRRALHEALCRGERDAIDLPCIPLSLGCGTQYFSLRLRPLRGADGSVESILGLGEDITARVAAEQALRTSEERFRSISTHSRDMVIISAADGTVAFESAAVESILGARRTPRPVISIFDNLHPDDAARTRERFARLVTDPAVGVVEDIEVRKQHEDGSWRWLEFTASNLLDDPAVRGVVLNGRDVTERKAAQLARQASEESLAAALWGAQAIYWSTDFETGTTHISDNFFSLTGIERSEWDAAVEPWCTWVHSDDAPMGCVRYRAHISGSTDFYEHEYRLRTPRGWLWLLDRGKIVHRDSSGRPLSMAGTTTDISARKALESTLADTLNREQRRLSHDLHDGLAQQLTGTALWLESVSTQLEHDRPEATKELLAIGAELRNAIEATKSLVRGVLPASIERGDVAPALRALAEETTGTGHLTVSCDTTEWDSRTLSADAAQHIYAIAQQVLRNACEHKEVKTVALALRADADYLILVMSHLWLVSTPASHDADTLSSRIIAYRAQALGGTLSKEHLPSGSKCIRLRCPARLGQPPTAFKPKRGFCDCIPLYDRNTHLVRRQ